MHASILLQRAWDKYGPECFTFHIIEYGSPSDLRILEQKWICLLSACNPEVGFNIAPFVRTQLKINYSDPKYDEMRRLRSISALHCEKFIAARKAHLESCRKGGPNYEATRALAEANLRSTEVGEKREKALAPVRASKYYREMMRRATTGIKRSDETRRRQSVSLKLAAKEGRLKHTPEGHERMRAAARRRHAEGRTNMTGLQRLRAEERLRRVARMAGATLATVLFSA